MCQSKKGCIFGAGKIGTGKGLGALRYLNLPVHFFCDNNPDRWGKTIIDDIVCISPKELRKLKDNVTCYLMMNPKFYDEVEMQLREMGINEIVCGEAILYNDKIIDKYYEEIPIEDVNDINVDREYTFSPLTTIKNHSGKKIAIYTCISGNYDYVTTPLYVDTKKFDYYIISDQRPEDNAVFIWIDLKSIVPFGIENNVRRNRFCKILGSEIFKEYNYSIYIDGNIRICDDITYYLDRVGSSGIALFDHRKYKDCIYIEGVDCIDFGKDVATVIARQMKHYQEEGMPRHYGLFSCGCIVRKNNHPILNAMMRMWWHEVCKYSYRDQLSFPYVLWKYGIPKQDVGKLGDYIYDAKELSFLPHLSDNYNEG